MRIAELVPWREFTLPSAPWADDETYCFNPSILRVPDDSNDGHAGKWLCNIRCTSYPVGCLDPTHWPGNSGFRSHLGNCLDRVGHSWCSHTRNWLLVLDARDWRVIEAIEIAGSIIETSYNFIGYEDLRLAWSPSDGLIASGSMLSERGVEIVVLDLDERYQIKRAAPIRGWWSDRCQKNWMPFLGGDRVRWLYSPDGVVMNRVGGGPFEVKKLSLSGGTQLVSLDDDRYLGLGHSFEPIGVNDRFYWHQAFVVNAKGQRLATSRPFKLSEAHIDFACGLAIDPRSPDRAIVTYGVDNRVSRLAEISLAALLELCG